MHHHKPDSDNWELVDDAVFMSKARNASGSVYIPKDSAADLDFIAENKQTIDLHTEESESACW